MNLKESKGFHLKDLATFVNGEVRGDGETLLTGVSDVEHAHPGNLIYAANPRMIKLIRGSKAGAVITAQPLEDLEIPQLIAPHPHYAFVCIANRFFVPPHPVMGIAEQIVRGTQVEIGPDVSIGPFVSLGNRVTIGARVTLYPGVVVGHDVRIGEDSVLYPNVSVREGCVVGSRVIIHDGAVIGSDGFGYVQHEGRHHKISQLGTVIIEDDVELGANVTIDRATFGQTVVKRGTKVDNQVQIAHNVVIGEDCILVAQVGIAGSTTLGRHVMIGGQAGLVDHLTIGDGAMIAAGSGVSHSIRPGQVVSGRPAIPHDIWLKSQTLVKRLPELRQQLLDLEKRIKVLESTPPPRKTRSTKKK